MVKKSKTGELVKQLMENGCINDVVELVISKLKWTVSAKKNHSLLLCFDEKSLNNIMLFYGFTINLTIQ